MRFAVSPLIARLIAGGVCLFSAAPAAAHVSERALVLILPTDLYTAFGVLAVGLTFALTVLLPARILRALFTPSSKPSSTASGEPETAPVASLCSFAVFAALLIVGAFGPRDPLRNLLPLTVLTAWWICLPPLQALSGDLWRHLNPWSGPAAVLFRGRHPLVLPSRAGTWPALASLVLAVAYMITDPAPADPGRLARVAAGYYLFHLVLCGLFGPQWLGRGEGLTLLLRLYARLSPLVPHRPFLRVPGHRLIAPGKVPAALGVFAVSALALGSFDGLNETFWWMSVLGINPLAFPGRSAVVWPNRLGLVAAVVALNALFALCVLAGLALVGRRRDFSALYGRFALALLPIALGYHVAHFLTSALVDLQYFALALDDPLGTGASLMGRRNPYVTTSFFNQHATVQAIWLAQAGAIVLAHMLAVLLSHALALEAFGTHRAAVLSQVPVAAFMVAYTLFGLWLLASPVAL